MSAKIYDFKTGKESGKPFCSFCKREFNEQIIQSTITKKAICYDCVKRCSEILNGSCASSS